MADADVVFSVTADDKEAQQKLNQLRREIERTSKAIENTGAKKDGITQQLEQARNAAKQTADEIAKVQEQLNATSAKMAGYSAQKHAGMASIPFDEYLAAKDTMGQQLARRAELQSALQKQQAEVAKLEGQEQKVLAVLQQQTAQLESQKTEAGGVERALAQQSTSVMPQLAAATEQVSTSMRRGLKNILKWGFGIRSAFILIRRLRNAIKEGVSAFAEQDAETKASIDGLKSSLQTLKLSWGAAFAPILNAVAPILQRLIAMLTAAANAIAQFFAILGGRGTYKKAIANNNKLAKSDGGAGGAAEKAEKQIMGFDEINKLNENSGGGGGGGGGGLEDALEEVEVNEKFVKLLDFVKEHLTEILALASLVGAALLAWRISKLLGTDFSTIFGILTALAGLVFLIKGYFDAWVNGVNWTNLKEILIGVGLLVVGITIAFGATAGIIVAVVAAVAMLILGFREWIKTGELSTQTFLLIVAAIALLGIALAPLTAGWSLLVAAIAIGALTIYKYWDEVKTAFENFILFFKERIDKWREVLPDDGSGVTMAFILGIIEGLWDGLKALFTALGNWCLQIIDKVKEFFGIHSPSTVFAEIATNLVLGLIQGLWDGITALITSITSWVKEIVDKIKSLFGINGGSSTTFVDIGKSLLNGLIDGLEETWQNVMQWFSDRWNALKTWWEGLSLGAFDFKTPHLEVAWEEIPSNSILARFLGFTAIPHIGINWYAKGGVVDGATLIGAGEAGKEAIVPLERNTEWVNMVANGIVDALTSSSKLEDYISGMELPSVMTGQIVPPRALNGGSMFTDGDIQRLVSGIAAAFTQSGGEESIKLYLDGKQIAETVTKHQRRMERGFA